MYTLKVDEEVTGYNKTVSNINELRVEVMNVLDEDVLEVSIKKKAATDNDAATDNTL